MEAFQLVAAALSVIGDPDKRRVYDLELMAKFGPGFGLPGYGMPTPELVRDQNI